MNEEILKKLAKCKNSGARAYAAHVAGRWSDRLKNPLNILEPLIQDSVGRVRLEALVGLSSFQMPESIVVAAKALNYPMDKFLRYALEKTAFALQDFWDPALKENKLIFKDPAQLAYTISVLPPMWYSSSMYRKLVSRTYDVDVKRRLMINLAKSGAAADIEFVLNNESVLNASFLEGLGKISLKQVDSAISNKLKNILETTQSAEVEKSTLRLIRLWNIKTLTETASEIVLNEQKRADVRGEGLQAFVLLRGAKSLPLLQSLVKNPKTPKQIQLASLKGLSGLDIQLASNEAISKIKRSEVSANDLKEVVSPIIDQRGGIKAFTLTLTDTTVSREKAGIFLEVLNAKGIDAPALKTLLNKLAGEKKLIVRNYNQQYVEMLSRQIKERGNVKNGQALYLANPSCSSCHTINGKGGNIGPNLSAIGKGLSTREIISEVLWPNQNIKEGYNRVAVETKTGELIPGIKIFENSDEIHVETTESKKPRVISKRLIASKTDSGSLMPSGLTDNYSEDELRDLLQYLSDRRN
jgi:putative heme-binding domain-containing protein